MTKSDILYILKLRMLYLERVGKKEAADEVGFLRTYFATQTPRNIVQVFSDQLGISPMSINQRLESGFD